VAKKAYADWSRFQPYTTPLHEAAIELVEIPRRAQSGKNSADIRLCVDAMDLAYSKEHIDTFVVVSGDSDFSPLVSKLKELGKHVIGLGMQESTSDLLRDNCDEFIYYEDLGQAPSLPSAINPQISETKRKAFHLLLESLLALRRENKEVLWSSMIKDTMKRKKPSFNEAYHGYRTFSELLEDAQREGLVELETDKRSRTYVVTRFGAELTHVPEPSAEPKKKKPSRRRRSAKKKQAHPVLAEDKPTEPEIVLPAESLPVSADSTEPAAVSEGGAATQPPPCEPEPIPDEALRFPDPPD
jgi:predicted transcriptional regulator